MGLSPTYHFYSSSTTQTNVPTANVSEEHETSLLQKLEVLVEDSPMIKMADMNVAIIDRDTGATRMSREMSIPWASFPRTP